jgi:serine/threonine-protein kinase
MEQPGRYEIESELGHGAMGAVYRALDPATGRTVAIKTIRLRDMEAGVDRERLRDRLLHEARFAGILSHLGIVAVYDVSEEDDLVSIAMEYVHGPTLEQLLSSEPPPEAATMFRILRETAAALDYAHKKGFIHLDIKPANIMIHEDGTVKITDFGVATEASMVMRTPCYQSPEQAQGRPVDGRSDQFSLAVMAFEMLTGEKPLPEKPLNPSLGWQGDAVLRRALNQGPAARFPTCTEFVRALEAACNPSRGWKPLPPTNGRKARHERVKVIVLVVLAVVILGLAGAWFADGRRYGIISGRTGEDQQTQEASSSRPSPAGSVIAGKAEPEAPAEPQAETAAAVMTPRGESTVGADVAVQVRTSPPGASVAFDGNQARACRTPCSMTLSPGRHTASATFPGYRPALRIFQLPDEGNLFLYMSKMTGEVQIITDPPGASILIDGEPVTTTTPATLTLAAGKCTVAIAKDGYRQNEQEIEVKDGAFLRLTISLGK